MLRMPIMPSPLQRGFTIMEMAVVLTILAMAVAGGLSIASRDISARQIETTHEKIRTIVEALENFVATHGYLPCPAGLDIDPHETNFGVGVFNDDADGCDNATGSPGTLGLEETSGNEAWVGSVPVSSLGLDPDYLVDAWGYRIMYVVDEDLTVDGSFETSTTEDIDIVAMDTVNDSPPTSILYEPDGTAAFAAMVVLSYGPNGYGAYRQKGDAPRITDDPLSRGVTKRNAENHNNHADSGTFDNIFMVGPLRTAHGTTSSAEYMDETNEIFDDIIYYRTKWSLQ